MTGTCKQWTGLVGVAVGLIASLPACAQEREKVAKEGAALVVDGVVREVFRSPRQGRTDYVIQIEVQRSEGKKAPKGGIRSPFPGPGDIVYVHAYQRQDLLASNATGSAGPVPAERAQVRAYLIPREQGGWEGTSPEWFELISDRPAAAGPADPAPSVEAPKERPPAVKLGLTTEPLKIQDRLVLRVTSVERGSPAQQAGLETGDLIVSAKGAALSGPEQLEQLAQSGQAIPLTVVDIHTGRTSEVELRAGTPTTASTTPTTPKSTEPKPNEDVKPQTPPPPARSLGIAAETVTIGQRTALKVTRVTPDSPAAKAGIEQGDVIVAANGAPITGAEVLATALRKSGPSMTLTVRDVRSGRETDVQVAFGDSSKPATEVTKQTEPPVVGGEKRKLGVVTELSFYDTEAAVKVTEVQPDSPGARAGLQPGTLILAANGKLMLHPNDLIEAARNSGTLKLTVVDPKTGMKSTLEVKLGG
jgi:S1-C subfamily serine protease